MNIKKIYKKIKKKKPNVFQRLYRRTEIFKERLQGLDFSKVTPSADLGFDDKLVSHCSPSGNKYLTRLLNDLSIGHRDNILDIGCGKGSAILRMTELKFNRVDGIEIASHNAEIARKNFNKLKINNVEIFNIDATKFSGYSNYNYFYFYNPFPDSIMELVISQILSQTQAGKSITIIYNNPVCHQVLIQKGLKHIKVYPDQWGNGINIYTNNGV